MTHTTGPDALGRTVGYNYEHFSLKRRTMGQLGGVPVGRSAPDFSAARLDGSQIRLCFGCCVGRGVGRCGTSSGHSLRWHGRTCAR